MWPRVLLFLCSRPFKTDAETCIKRRGALDLHQNILAGGRVYGGNKTGQGLVTIRAGGWLGSWEGVMLFCIHFMYPDFCKI